MPTHTATLAMRSQLELSMMNLLECLVNSGVDIYLCGVNFSIRSVRATCEERIPTRAAQIRPKQIALTTTAALVMMSKLELSMMDTLRALFVQMVISRRELSGYLCGQKEPFVMSGCPQE